MSLESLNNWLQILGAILLGLTFFVGTGAVITGRMVGKRQEMRIAAAGREAAQAVEKSEEAKQGTAKALVRVAEANGRASKLEVQAAEQRERAAVAERALLELKQRMQDRHLTDEQRSTIANRLVSSAKGALQVDVLGNNPEALRFSSEIVDVLKGCGWSVKREAMFTNNPWSGLFIRVRSKSAPRAVALQKALLDAGIDVSGQENSDLPEDTVILMVGSKP